MNFKSIKFKLLSLITLIFAFIALSIFFVIDNQLTKIIDSSESELYQAKLQMLCDKLYTVNEKLEKTGLVDVYKEGFQESILSEWKKLYYTDTNPKIYPVVFNSELVTLMHPSVKYGIYDPDLKLVLKPLIEQANWKEGEPYTKLFTKEYGSFISEYNNIKKWYTYRRFDSFNWIILYGVPLDTKYEDLFMLRKTISFIIGFIIIFSITILAIFISKLTKPIIHLTKVSSEFANGNFIEEINITSDDEVGRLAKSFISMRNSINEKIEALNSEISQKITAEEKLTKAQMYIENIINSMPSIVIGVDNDIRITHWNSMAMNITSKSINDVKGELLSNVLPQFKEQIDKIEASINNRDIISDKDVEKVTNKKTQYFDITIYPVETETGVGAVIRIDDVTEQFNIEAQLNKTRRMDALGQLVGGISHDFNNMLGGIVTSMHLLKMTTSFENESSLELIDIIEQSTIRASELINQLLLFSRKQSGKAVPLSMHKIIEDAHLLLKRSLDKKITIDTYSDAKHDTTIGDASQLQNVIMNMCINSSHAMINGGNIVITTRNIFLDEEFCKQSAFAITPSEYIEIEIQDNGEGISPENMEKIFDPFFTTKEPGKGTGLGLSSVYRIICNHNGAINVFSDVGIGTTFFIYLPVTITSNSTTTKKVSIVTGTGTILLVDDDFILRNSVSKIIQSLGYKVITAENGKEALGKYMEHQKEIDLVISDMIMPEMNGKELFDTIKKINDNCKVVLISGFSKENDVKEMINNGLCEFVKKPFTIEHLSQVIAKHM